MAESDPYVRGRNAYEAFVRTTIEQKNPYRVGSEGHDLWIMGYDDANAEEVPEETDAP